MDKTLKIRAYTEAAKSDASKGDLTKELDASLELEKKNALLADEKSKSLELLKTIVQLRESLKQEQAKSADLEAKLNKLAVAEENQLARKNAQLEEEKRLSLEYMRTIEQLRESIKQDRAKSAEMLSKFDELEAKRKALSVSEARIKELTGVLGAISRIAATGKLDSDA